MKKAGTAMRRNGTVRCAIYTRKSSEEGLEQEFNSLQVQREACEAFINSQRHEGWVCLRTAYDDGGFSGATMARPALDRLLADITAGRIDAARGAEAWNEMGSVTAGRSVLSPRVTQSAFICAIARHVSAEQTQHSISVRRI
jgi:hypothetical protein